jgi:Hint domain
MAILLPTFGTFDFAYKLTGTLLSHNFRIADDFSDPHDDGYVDPVATGVTLEDPDGGKLTSSHPADVVGISLPWDDIFQDGQFTFIGVAKAKDHAASVSGLIVQDANGNYFLLTNDEYTGKLNGHNGELSIIESKTTLGTGGVGGDPFCFTAGTLIRTPDGEAAVETLKRGDRVLTQDGRVATVDWLGIQTISMRFADKLRVSPIRIRAGAIAENVPSRDLLLSPDHAILVEGALIQAGALVNGTSIVRETKVPVTFKYYHVEVEDHSLILAENTPAETFVDNVERLAFDNWAEHEALYPDGKPITELPYPRAKSQRQVPVSTRVMLAARADAIGAAASGVAAA